MKKRYYFLYITTNLVNGKYYKGQHATDDLFDGYLGSGKAFRRALQKYGRKSFKRRIVLFLPDLESLAAAEKLYITNEDLLNRDCYNLREGGSIQPGHHNTTGHKLTAEQKEAMSRRCVDKYNKKKADGLVHYEVKNKQRKAPIVSIKNSESHLGELNPMYGRVGELNPTSKPVYCIELEKPFGSAMLAAKELGIAFQNISKVCQGKRRTCGGYHWCFEENKEAAIQEYRKQQQLVMPPKAAIYTPDAGSPGQVRPVICIDTQERFASLSKAMKALGAKGIAHLIEHCKSGEPFYGKHWMFLEDYERMMSVQHSQEQTLCNSASPEDLD